MSTWFLALWTCALPHAVVATPPNPRVYRIDAHSLYEAGRQHGALAAPLMSAWFELSEFQAMVSFVSSTDVGKRAFSQLKRDNAAAFPELVQEMQGLADGAGVDVDKIWISNLVPEIEALMPRTAFTTRGHCSDVYGHTSSNDLIHGHNEDWSEAVKPLWYFVSYTALPGANFSSCAGLSYPGTLIGYAPTWGAKGMYITQNTLFPGSTREQGLGCIFAQRRAACGIGGGDDVRSLEDMATRLDTGNWAAGASVNVVDLTHKRMANIEAYENGFSMFNVTRNYTHFNMFKHLVDGERVDLGDTSTVHRQSRVDSAFDPATSTRDVARMLGDTADATYPLYRSSTLTTLILDGATSELSVWIGENPLEADPHFKWDLATFFDTQIVV